MPKKPDKMSEDQLGEILRFRQESIDYRDVRFADEWTQNMEFYFGLQYTEEYLEDLAFWRSATVQNIIYPTVEQIHSLMTDDESIAFVQRDANGTFQGEKMLDSIIKQTWAKEDVISNLSEMNKDRLIFGTGFMKTWYDKDSDAFLKIRNKRISTWDFFPDRSATTIKNARFVFERERTTKAALLERYPEHFDLIKGAAGNATNPMAREGNSRFSTAYEQEAVFIWHCYINELSEFETEVHSEEDAKKIKRTYPNGKYIVLLGDVPLEEGKNKHQFFPYTRIPLIEIPDEFFGMSVVTQMKLPQEELNKTESILLDNLKSNINPIFKVSQGVLEEEFVPLPNSIVTMRDENSVFEKVPGVQVPSEAFAMMSQKKEEARASAGVSDVTFGQGAQSSRPGTVRSNFNASVTRIREYLRLQHRGIAEMGGFIIKMVQSQVPVNTTISLVNEDDVVFDLADENVSKEFAELLRDPNISKNLEVQNIIIGEQTQEFKDGLADLVAQGQGEQLFTQEEAREILLKKDIQEFKNDLREGEYSYAINTHPISINDPDKMLELMQALLQYGAANPQAGTPGIIDFEFVLEQIPLKGKGALIRRQKRKQKLLEQQLAAQQQQQGGAPNGQQG